MKEPSYDYKADLNNAWTFYNHITHALKRSHPRTWMSDQVKFHEFMTAELLSQAALKKQDTSWPVDFIADMEAQEYDTFEEFKI